MRRLGRAPAIPARRGLCWLLTGLAGVSLAAAQRPVPRPDLGTMEAASRQKIEKMQSALERMQSEVEVRSGELAEGFGYLGQLFHAFDLLDAAEECYRDAQALAPDDHRWSYYLGLVLYTKGELQAALLPLERALAQAPGNVATLIRLATAQLGLGDIEAAGATFAQVLAIDAESAAAYAGLGKVAALAGDNDEAIRQLTKAVELQPEATVLHYPLGQAYRKQGDLERARWHLQRRGQQEVVFSDSLGNRVAQLSKGAAYEVVLAMAQQSESFSENQFLGFALSQLAGVDGAIEQLKRGLILAEESDAEATAIERGRIHYVLGGLLVEAGRDLEAIEQFRAAAELDPRLLDARIKLGNALARDGRMEGALAEYDAVLATQPDHLAALSKRAVALLELGHFEDARAALERWATLDPRSSEAQIRLAATYRRLDQVEEAIARLRSATALELTPLERVGVHTQLAMLLRQRGEMVAAEEQLRLALAADPGHLPAQRALAGLLGQLGRYQEAAVQYGILIALEPANEVTRVAEATALILGGQSAAARRRLEVGLDLLPHSLPIIDLLARHLAASPDRSVRDGDRAIVLSRELIAAVPTVESFETLAMAYAEAGKFSEAVETQERLLAGLEEEADAAPEDRQRLRRHLELYRRGLACCGD